VDRRARSPLIVACAVAALAAAAAGIVLQGRFPVADNAMFEYVGRAIAHGSMLYRDVWDNKLPGIYYVDAVWQFLFGEAYVLHAVAEACVALLSAALLALVMRSFGLASWPLVFAALVTLLCLVSPLNSTESYALPLLLTAILAARRSWIVISGVLVGIASFFWLPSLLTLIPICVVVPPKLRASLVVAAVAFVVVLAGITAYTLHPTASLTLARSWIAYVSTPPAPEVHHRFRLPNSVWLVWSAIANLYFGAVLAGAASLALLVAATLRRPSTQAQRFGLVWTVASLAGAFTGTRFYSHYFIVSLAAMLFTIAAYGFGRLNPARAVLVVLAALLAFRTYQDARTVWSATYAQSAIAARIGTAARPAVARTLTLGVTSYRPEFYLALDPVLRSPYEIAGDANHRFLTGLLGDLPAPAVQLAMQGSHDTGVRVCARSAAPWKMFSVRADAPRFDRCP
jgi:hypothetical protein